MGADEGWPTTRPYDVARGSERARKANALPAVGGDPRRGRCLPRPASRSPPGGLAGRLKGRPSMATSASTLLNGRSTDQRF